MKTIHDHNEMMRLYKSGLSGKEVAGKMGIKHSNTVRQILKRMGVLRNQSQASKLALANGKKDKALQALIISARTTNRFNPLKSNRGDKSGKWIADRSKLKGKRGLTEEKWFFKEVISDRQYKCEITGLNGTLSVHHIKGVWQRKDLMFDKTNCIVILKPIHIKFHLMYGNRSTEKDWIEFLQNKEYEDCIPGTKKRNYVPFEDKTGMKFGRLTVMYRDGKLWRCICECGNETLVCSGGLNKGATKSCGCLMREVNRDRLNATKIWELSPASKRNTIVNRKNKKYVTL